MTRYVIVGMGAAGVAAAEAIRSIDPSGDIVMVAEESAGYYSRPGLAYVLTNELPESHLFPFSKQDFKRLKIKQLQTRITKIISNDHIVENAEGKRLSYDRLLIAVGAQAARAQLPGIELKGVVKLDNLADTRNIIKLAKKARVAVVVGGGITALELVEGLRARRVKTHYLLRKDRYWGNVLDETESKIIESRLTNEGVKIHYYTEIDEIVGKNGKVIGVKTKDGKLINCQMVAVAIGIRPRKQIAESAGIATDRGILVNEYLQTNQEDIYAAGDVAQVFDPATGTAVLDSLWGPARQQGRSAGLNMAGRKTVYSKGSPFNVTRLTGLTTTIIGSVGTGDDDDLTGIARGDSETWRKIPDAIASQSNFKVNRIRLMVGKQTLLGAVIMGDQKLSIPIQQIVSEQMDISSIRGQLLEADASVADVILGYWNSRRSANAA